MKPAPSGATPRFDAQVIARFLCGHHGVQDVSQIEPWGKRTLAWEVCRSTVLPVEVSSDGAIKPLGNPQPREPFKHPVTGAAMAVDLDRVYIYNIACRSYVNTTGRPWAVRLNYYHSSMSELQDTRAQDDIYAEAGLKEARGAFAMLTPTGPEGKDMSEVPLIETSFAYQNGDFVRTMALLNEGNLHNGLVRIPHEVCVAARLPVWLGDDKAFMPSDSMIAAALRDMQATPQTAEAMRAHYVNNYRREMLERWGDKPRSHYYVAMPVNHVLAWGFHSETYRASGGQNVEEFRFSAPGLQVKPLLYYLVPEALFNHTMTCLMRNWMGKVDTRPLTSVGFEFVPQGQGGAREGPDQSGQTGQAKACPTGQLKMRAHITYYASPPLSPATQAGLGPALSLGMPSCHLWSREDMERDAAVRDMHASESEAQMERK